MPPPASGASGTSAPTLLHILQAHLLPPNKQRYSGNDRKDGYLSHTADVRET